MASGSQHILQYLESLSPWLDRLLQALEAEAEALASRKVEALEAAVRQKQDSLARFWTYQAQGLSELQVLLGAAPAQELPQLIDRALRSEPGLPDMDRLAPAWARFGRALGEVKRRNEANGRALAVQGAEVSQALQALRDVVGPQRGHRGGSSLYQASGMVNF